MDRMVERHWTVCDVEVFQRSRDETENSDAERCWMLPRRSKLVLFEPTCADVSAAVGSKGRQFTRSTET